MIALLGRAVYSFTARLSLVEAVGHTCVLYTIGNERESFRRLPIQGRPVI